MRYNSNLEGSTVKATGRWLYRFTIVVTLLFLTLQNVMAVSNNYITWLNFEDDIGSVSAKDQNTTSANNGILVNVSSTTGWNNSGKYGSAIDLNLSNYEYLNLGSGSELSNKTGTISFWLYSNKALDGNLSSDVNFITKGNTSSTYEYFLDYQVSTQKIILYTKFSAQVVSANKAIPANQWHMVTVVFMNNSTSSAIFYDGSDISGTRNAQNINTGSGLLKIGGDVSHPNVTITIDEYKFWDRALNASQVAEEYNNTISSCSDDIKYVGASYKLNLSMPSPGASCLTVNGNNSYVDLNGYSLSGDLTLNTNGVNIQGQNSTVTNGSVLSFNRGVVNGAGKDNLTLSNLNISDNANIGVRLSFTNNTNIISSIINNQSSWAVYQDTANQNNNISNNTLSGNGLGIQDQGINSILSYNIVNSTATPCGSDGGFNLIGQNQTISWNIVTAVVNGGIAFGNNGAVYSNFSNNNGSTKCLGFELDTNSSWNVYVNNTVSGTQAMQFWNYHASEGIHPVNNNTVKNNVFKGIGSGTGIHIRDNTTNNTFENNTFSGYNDNILLLLDPRNNFNKGCGNTGTINDSSGNVNYISNITQACSVWQSETISNSGRLASNGTYIIQNLRAAYTLSTLGSLSLLIPTGFSGSIIPISGNGMNINPSSGLINVTMSRYFTSGNYSKQLTATGTGGTLTFTVGDNPIGGTMQVTKDGDLVGNYAVNETGYITFSSPCCSIYEISVTPSLSLWKTTQNDVPNHWANWSSMLAVLSIVVVVGIILSFLFLAMNGGSPDVLVLVMIAGAILAVSIVLIIGEQIGYLLSGLI